MAGRVRDPHASVRGELKELDVRPQKSRGQNFLADNSAIDEILSFAGLREDLPVVEVGPGLGALTYHLARSVKELAVIEVEPDLAEKLRANLPDHCKVIESDMRNVELSAVFNRPVAVVSNVPYSISTDFIFWLFRECKHVVFASLLLQKEFAQRLAASEGSRAYGSLSVMRARYASAELGPIVKPESFHPRPKVDSQLVRLDFSAPPIHLGEISEEFFEKFVRACFSKKRKTLLNSLSSSELFPDKDSVRNLLATAGHGESIRAEELSPVQLLELARLFRAES